MRGYAPRGQKLFVRGEFTRSNRVSLLCFIGVNGLLEACITNGTFTRLKFFEHCRRFAKSGKCQVYPGIHSIWVMDGAKIHCDASIIDYLRTVGIVVVFLPAYCPFFNPIEISFGLVKKRMRRYYQEGAIPPKQLPNYIGSVLASFRNYNMSRFFDKCGYQHAGRFNPGRAYRQAVSVFSRGLDEDDTPELDDAPVVNEVGGDEDLVDCSDSGEEEETGFDDDEDEKAKDC